ncbi:mechanosensitive ion channel family protein [Pseudoalteromonas peptidolytica]|uniref:mechanosensitive ion channel family protein n=1 Tax=Pseudoalteromonas peptidolytica TaxID=61150 RepID=UPI00298D9727|nr:mechanosensitive ion channel family protein [Pseudoalteromonas peptidolytica]MDW7547781.1 mechanosensitive ion channel family protein [Pseudoalteromonas peptidolytica]
MNIEKFWTLINDKLISWLEAAVQLLPNLVLALATLLVFIVLAKVASVWFSKAISKAVKTDQVATLITSIFKISIIVIGIFFALDIVRLSGAVMSLLAGAGIIGLAIGFAFQDMTENLIAGFVMGVRKPFVVGDIIKTKDCFGTVSKINLRNTLVENFYGQLSYIPNKILFKNELQNYTKLGKRRIEIPFGISYSDDPEHARKVIVEAINELDFVVNKQESDVYAESFGDSSINLLLWFWVDYPKEPGFMLIRHRAICTINKVLADNNILIPFPIRTLDFNAKGGSELGAQLSRE